MTSIPLLITEGDAHARGRAHGRRFAREIADNVETYLRRFAASGLGRGQALAEAERWLGAIELESPVYAEEMRGIAEGCGQGARIIALLNGRYELAFTLLGEEARKGALLEAGPDGCTTFGLLPEATADRHTWLGQNWDWLEGVHGRTFVLRARRRDGPSFICLTEAGIAGGKMGVNECGVALVENGLASSHDGRNPYRKPFHVRCREVLEPGGAVALFGGGVRIWNGQEPWEQAVVEVIQRWLGPERRAGQGSYTVAHEPFAAILARAGLVDIRVREYGLRHVWEIDSLIGLLYSTSFCRRDYLGPGARGDRDPARPRIAEAAHQPAIYRKDVAGQPDRRQRRRREGLLGLGPFGLRRAQHRPGQLREPVAQRGRLAEFADQAGEIAGLLGERQGVLALAVGHPGGGSRHEALPRLDPGQPAAPLGELGPARLEPVGGGLGLLLEQAEPGEFAAERGGPALDLGHHRCEHGAQVHRVVDRAGPQQGKDHRTAREPLQRRGQLDQGALLAGQDRA